MMSVAFRAPLASSAFNTLARFSSALRIAARLCLEPGPVRCWERSGSFIHNNENAGTPSAHNGSIKAAVVQSLRVGLVPLSAGNSPLRLVITPNRSAGSVEPANTLAPAAQDVRGARWLMCDVGRISAKAVPLAVELRFACHNENK